MLGSTATLRFSKSIRVGIKSLGAASSGRCTHDACRFYLRGSSSRFSTRRAFSQCKEDYNERRECQVSRFAEAAKCKFCRVANGADGAEVRRGICYMLLYGPSP